MKTHPHPQNSRQNQQKPADPPTQTHFELQFAGTTDVGIKRATNQDAYLLAPDDDLFVIADGMGGHAAGEVASRLTCDLIGAYFQETADMKPADMPMPYPLPSEMHDPEQRLVTAVKLANTAVYQQSIAIPEQNGMGTTVVAVHIAHDKIFWAHVGDSRLYRIRNNTIMQLTSDHSLLNHAIEQRGLKGAELREFVQHFPYKNVLVRAIGVRTEIEVEYGHAHLQNDDLFLLCTDGAHNLLEPTDFTKILQKHPNNLQTACNQIIREANKRGGPDNITAILLHTHNKTLH